MSDKINELKKRKTMTDLLVTGIHVQLRFNYILELLTLHFCFYFKIHHPYFRSPCLTINAFPNKCICPSICAKMFGMPSSACLDLNYDYLLHHD